MSEKKYQGKMVVLERPVIVAPAKGLIELDKTTTDQLEAEQIHKWTKLKVHGVGADVTFVTAGDEVYVTPKQLSYADVAEFDGGLKLLIKESDIVFKY